MIFETKYRSQALASWGNQNEETKQEVREKAVQAVHGFKQLRESLGAWLHLPKQKP